jgi:hypothetical protein
MCRLLRTGTHFTDLISTCVYFTGRGILIGHCMNMMTLIRKLLFHSVTRTAPLQNDMPYTVQLTVFCRTPLRHAMSTLLMQKIPLSDAMILLVGFICCYKTSVKHICCQPLLLRTNYQVIFRNSICSIGYQEGSL